MKSNSKVNRLCAAYREGGVSGSLRAMARFGMRTVVPRSVYSLKEKDVLTSEDIKNQCIEGETLWFVCGAADSEANPRPFESLISGIDVSEDRFCSLPKLTYRGDFVCEYPNVRLLGPHGIAVTPDTKLIRDSIAFPEWRSYEVRAVHHAVSHHPLTSIETLFTTKRSRRRSSMQLDTACSLFSSYNNYYHWTVEHLPKLRAIEAYTEATSRQPLLIVPNNPPSYIRQSLRLLGYDSDRCVEWEGPAIDVDNLVLPSYPEPTRENLTWLKTKMVEAAQDIQLSKTPDRIYISRENAKRRISNQEEVIGVLERYGFKKVLPETLSLSEQVALFAGAEAIVGPHGAGFTNMIWGDNLEILEIFNDSFVNCYHVLAGEMGHEYYPYMAEGVDAGKDADIIVDPHDLDAFLKRSLTRTDRP